MKIIKESVRENSSAFMQGYIRNADAESGHFKYPAIVIVPGGSYTHIPINQAESFALTYAAQGYQSFFLRYTFESEAKPLLPNPLIELANTIKMIKAHAVEWNIDENKIVIAGFSIGGHIVSLFNDLYDSTWFKDVAKIDDVSQIKPAATILGYPVINLKLGFPNDEEKIANWIDNDIEMAADEHVTQTNVPTFIWATTDDPVVPSMNAIKYAEKLNENSVDNELHLFHHGPHGLALANDLTAWNDASNDSHVAKWFQLSNEWLKEIL
ncbi:alpha/beta hydrolase [Apilactobacillus ozensis]|uniref:alpha/beta hydrolase n=1 Tax=Apilactobacillus ozensis TaxID=866801 RepID=UPI00200AD065|nr:alpha/beta hydrolase [Apilactobacillus ozensis]MCK8606689.1 alpha/beta hydrolase [Apilactobacillus ozensis]